MGLKTDQGAVDIEEYGFNHCVFVYNNIIISSSWSGRAFVCSGRPADKDTEIK